MGWLLIGVWVDESSNTTNEAWNFFSSRFDELMNNRPKLISNKFKILPTGDRATLTRSFSKFVIKETVWCYGNDKASGPDGFTFKFLKKFWELIKNDMIMFMPNFEGSVCWLEDATLHLYHWFRKIEMLLLWMIIRRWIWWVVSIMWSLKF